MKDQERDMALRRLTGEEIMEETKKQAVKAWGKILPFGAQVVASAAAYSVGITATQLVGFVLKISCATPVLGPTMGLVGVGLANVLAGQASKHTRKAIVMRSHPLAPGFWEAPNPEDLVLDAVMGACIFKALGGRFSSVMPSDLTKPGALAFESIPARADNSEAYAAPSVKRELARIFKRDGCHHCGSRKAPVIGDHMPPTKLLQGNKDQLGKWIRDLPVIGKVTEVVGVGGRGWRGPLQRFYPQCQRCSIKQAGAVRNGKRVLVLHLTWPRRGRGEQLAGVFVGLRYNAPDLDGSSSGDQQRRRSGRWASLTLAAASSPFDGARIVDMRSPCLEVSGLSLQQLPCPLAPELSTGSSLHRGWASSRASSSNACLQVTPLLEGSAAAGSTAAWHDQQQQQHGLYSHSSSPPGGGAAGGYLGSSSGAYASGVVSYGASPKQGAAAAGFKVGGGALNPAAEGGKMGQHGSGAKGGGGLALMQHAPQQRQRGVSGAGDERLPDQNQGAHTAAGGEAQGAALMVSLEAWASSPTRHRSAAGAAMAPEHAKARADAAFERHFASGQLGYN